MTRRSHTPRAHAGVFSVAVLALVALHSVVSSGQAPPANHTRVGHLYEDQKNWAAAEAAYAKALEVASSQDRAAAERDLQRVLAKKETLWDGYVAPFASRLYDQIESWFTTLVTTVPVLALVWVVLLFARKVGARRGKNKLLIGTFVDATRVDAGIVFAEILKNAIERVQEYYRPRDRFRFGAGSSMTLVESPEPGPLVELISEIVSAETGKVWAVIRKSYFRPQYRIAGTFQRIHGQYRVWLRLADSREIVGTWDRGYGAGQYGGGQEQLAFEVAMFVKDQVQTHGD